MQDDVTRETSVGLPPEAAWEAVIDPDGMADWLGEPLELELQPGGELRLRLPGGEQRTGWIEEVDPPRRLTFWWAAEGEEATRVELRLDAEGDGTLLRVTESRPLAALESRAIELGDAGGSPGGPVMLVTV